METLDFNVLNLAEKDSIKKALASLDAINASTVPEIHAVANTLYSFLKLLNTQDENWTKLKLRIEKEYPEFISKVQVAYIYYYARVLEKQFLNTEDDIKSPNTFKSKIRELKAFLKNEKNGKDLFDFLFSGETPGVAADEIAKGFFNSAFMLHNDILDTSEFHLDPSDTDPASYFRGPAKELPNREKGEILSHISKLEKAKSPEMKIYAAIVEDIFDTQTLGSYFDAERFLKHRINELLLELGKEKPKTATFYREFLNDINGKVVDDTTRKGYLEKLAAVADAEKPQEKSEEEPKEESTEYLKSGASERDLLAMNMADYITGRITASEFQQRDLKIKAGREQVLNEEE